MWTRCGRVCLRLGRRTSRQSWPLVGDPPTCTVAVSRCQAPVRRCSHTTTCDGLDVEATCAQLGLPADDPARPRLHLIMLEYSELLLNGEPAPQQLRSHDWSELLLLDSAVDRQRHFSYLFQRQCHLQAKREREKLEEQVERQRVAAFASHLPYGTCDNSIIDPSSYHRLRQHLSWRLVAAMQFGQPLVIDMDYEQYMSRRDCQDLARQLADTIKSNRRHLQPFDIHLCNLPADSLVMNYLYHQLPYVREENFPLNQHSVSYLDLYPRDRLVYLTPHCQQDLEEFDHDSVYILGGYSDRRSPRSLSSAKAQGDGLRMARLPLHRHLHMITGFSALFTLEEMLNVLLSLSDGQAWRHALGGLSRSKLLTEQQFQEKQRLLKQRHKLARLKSERLWLSLAGKLEQNGFDGGTGGSDDVTKLPERPIELFSSESATGSTEEGAFARSSGVAKCVEHQVTAISNGDQSLGYVDSRVTDANSGANLPRQQCVNHGAVVSSENLDNIHPSSSRGVSTRLKTATKAASTDGDVHPILGSSAADADTLDISKLLDYLRDCRSRLKDTRDARCQ